MLIDNNDITPIVAKIKAIQNYLNAIAFERAPEIEGIILATISKSSCFFYGDVGTAKTYLIRNTTELLGMRMFDVLMSETVKPDAIFGPIDVPALAQGIQRTKYKNYAPDSEILFFDEIFKANSTVLNPLLWLINEKQYRNGDEGIIDCPLVATFAASNEIPSDDVLKAIYDRLLLRYHVEYIKNNKNLKNMLRSNLTGNRPEKPEPLTREELETFHEYVCQMPVSDDIINIVLNIKTQLLSSNIQGGISDRRLSKAFVLMQAKAALRGGSSVLPEDLEILSNLFWNDPSDAERVIAVVSSFISSNSSNARSYFRVAEGIWTAALKSGDFDKATAAFEELKKKFSEDTTSKTEIEVIEYINDRIADINRITNTRNTFILIRIPIDNRIEYNVDKESSMAWTPKQMRSAGLSFSRKNSTWMHHGLTTQKMMANQALEEQNIINSISSALGTTVEIKDL